MRIVPPQMDAGWDPELCNTTIFDPLPYMTPSVRPDVFISYPALQSTLLEQSTAYKSSDASAAMSTT